MTFNNTCYGRLLTPCGGLPPPAAADCYRYSLAQPAVRCCLSAPATLEQLEENLAALRDPDFADGRRRQMLTHGAALYEKRRCSDGWCGRSDGGLRHTGGTSARAKLLTSGRLGRCLPNLLGQGSLRQ